MKKFFRKYEWEILLLVTGVVMTAWVFWLGSLQPKECRGSDVPRYCVEG